MKIFKPAILILFLSLQYSITVSAQNFSGYFITLSSDTIDCIFDLPKSLFFKDFISACDFEYIIKIYDSAYPKNKFRPDEIRGFRINESNGDSQMFIPLYLHNRLRFVELIEEGEINLYRASSLNLQDGSCIYTYVVKNNSKPPHAINSFIPQIWKRSFFRYLDDNEWFKKHLKPWSEGDRELPRLVKYYNEEVIGK